MILNILLLSTLVAIFFYIAKKFNDLYKNLERRITLVKNIITHPAETAGVVGAVVAETIFNQVAKFIRPKSKS